MQTTYNLYDILYIAIPTSFPLRLSISFQPSFDFSSMSHLLFIVPLHCVAFLHCADLAEFIYKAHGLSVSSSCIVLHPAIISILCSKVLHQSILHMQILYCHCYVQRWLYPQCLVLGWTVARWTRHNDVLSQVDERSALSLKTKT